MLFIFMASRLPLAVGSIKTPQNIHVGKITRPFIIAFAGSTNLPSFAQAARIMEDNFGMLRLLDTSSKINYKQQWKAVM
jgi:hypothetical protein